MGVIALLMVLIAIILIVVVVITGFGGAVIIFILGDVIVAIGMIAWLIKNIGRKKK